MEKKYEEEEEAKRKTKKGKRVYTLYTPQTAQIHHTRTYIIHRILIWPKLEEEEKERAHKSIVSEPLITNWLKLRF